MGFLSFLWGHILSPWCDLEGCLWFGREKKRNKEKIITLLHPLGRGNHSLLVPAASRAGFSGPGLFSEAVQKVWGGSDPPASRDYHSAQPWAGRQVPLLSQSSLKLHICSIFYCLLSMWLQICCWEGRVRHCLVLPSSGISMAACTVLPVCRQRSSPQPGSYGWKSSFFPLDSVLMLYSFAFLTGKG